MILCYRLTFEKKPRPEQTRPGMPSSKPLLLSSVPNPYSTSRASFTSEAAAFSPKSRRKPRVLKEYTPPPTYLSVLWNAVIRLMGQDMSAEKETDTGLAQRHVPTHPLNTGLIQLQVIVRG
ncbi:hypothetical protein KOW79_011195 [Hemibagrus wyckioides]|uniref:Uncharacterized protein n=1 Tax=Hemibagrus wyckioides TaxID=337641 RepID=A0A9D3NM55_9TELE|nr:hypothetical protein KOW79_011195 [Hemibagrus wyckioides]